MKAQRRIVRVLRWGAAAALTLIAAGALALLSGGFPVWAEPVGPMLAPLSARTLIQWGLAALMATPAVRVLAAGLGFLAEGDRRHALAAFGVLALLAVGFSLSPR